MARTLPHPKEIKARLAVQHGSVTAFERKFELPPGSTFDVLRGRTSSGRTIEAVSQELGISILTIRKSVKAAERADRANLTSENSDSHRLIAGAK